MDKIIVTILGLASMGFVYWFFLMRKEEEVAVMDSVDIIANGGYSPEVITVKKNQPVTLNFKRTDPSNCLDEVSFPDFRQHLELPLNEIVSTTITPKEVGEFTYSCGMNMFHGKIIVKE
jgi:plastocyanin domain-containing protein